MEVRSPHQKIGIRTHPHTYFQSTSHTRVHKNRRTRTFAVARACMHTKGLLKGVYPILLSIILALNHNWNCIKNLEGYEVEAVLKFLGTNRIRPNPHLGQYYLMLPDLAVSHFSTDNFTDHGTIIISTPKHASK